MINYTNTNPLVTLKESVFKLILPQKNVTLYKILIRNRMNRYSIGYKFIYLLCFVLTVTIGTAQEAAPYEVYGKDFEKKDIIESENVAGFYNKISATDSMTLTFKAKVNSVCKMKGCWMKLDVGNNKEVMVKFKDYAFFVPKNIEGREVIVDGKAFVNIVSIEELRHYAKDAGKTAAEVALITKPSKTYSFEAEGVKIVE